MALTAFIWLGSKRAKKHNVGHKGRLLDEATRAGLPVPKGAIVLDEFYRLALDEGVIAEENGRLHQTEPGGLHALLYDVFRFPRLEKAAAVRAAFSAEDQARRSLAGLFTTRLNVNVTDPAALAAALCDVWSSAGRYERPLRRDVLIMEMVAGQAGVAFSESAYQDDLVYAGDGETMRLPQLEGWESSQPDLPPFAQRLQQLLRGVRRTFGRRDWNIEWADDGRICYLVQLRPVTRPTRRNDAFIYLDLDDWPELPASPLRQRLLAAAGEHLQQQLTWLDPNLSAVRPFLKLIKERPYLNLTFLTDVARKWGMSTDPLAAACPVALPAMAPFRWGRALRHGGVRLRRARYRPHVAATAVANHTFTAAADALTSILAAGLAYAPMLRWLFGRDGPRPDALAQATRKAQARLQELAQTAVTIGQLPEAAALWLLTVAEVQALDTGAVYTPLFFNERRQENRDRKAYQLPALIHRFDDLDRFHPEGKPNPDGRLFGLSLTPGTVDGRAWVLSQPQTTLPDGFTPETTILVAPTVDANWRPTLALAAGVVVESGHSLSHGAIVLREVGLPAVTNVRQATAQIQTGDSLRLEAGKGVVWRETAV